MNTNKRIILDFDDTISFTKDRNWENAEPNIDLIKRCNDLYDSGWRIDIYTARGSISCRTRREAKEKYGRQIEKWLVDHGVKYHNLSFNKPLATYYVDDKGITPEDFLKIDIHQLQGGLSTADIYTDGNFVYKEDIHARNVIKWFEMADKHGFHVPKIHRLISNIITMEYIDNVKHYLNNKTVYQLMGRIKQIVDHFCEIKPLHELIEDNSLRVSFNDYLSRIESHVEYINANSDSERLKIFAQNVIEYINRQFTVDKNFRRVITQHSFAHGDFSVSNLLDSSDKLYMIDPITHTFSHPLLDSAKFIASLINEDYSIDLITVCFNEIHSYWADSNISRTLLLNLIYAEYIRIYKYHPDKILYENHLTMITNFVNIHQSLLY